MPPDSYSTAAAWRNATRLYYLKSVLLLAGVFVTALVLGLFLIHGALGLFDVGQVLVIASPVGLLLGVYEVHLFPRLFHNRSLGIRLLLGTTLYLLAFALLLGIGQQVMDSLLREALQNAAFAKFFRRELLELRRLPQTTLTVANSMITRALTLYLTLVVSISVLYQTGRKIGLRSLGRLVTGYYSQPVQEDRLFLFVDLKDSTTLAEQLGNLRYSAFIRDFFHDVGGPIAATRGEVYQYVGDEVVVTWEWAAGLRQARCLQCFFGMQQAVNSRRAYYLQHYGVVPAFKAGLHGGSVVATQVGDIKSALVFHGDVLNTTARIQAQCNALQSQLLVSGTLLQALKLKPPHYARQLGFFTLRGKIQSVELYDISEDIGLQPPNLASSKPRVTLNKWINGLG